jgi:hypothetical protein
LSTGKPALSSSVEPGYPAVLAVDGDPATRWSSAFTDPQWLQVDLGSTQALGRVELNWEVAYGKTYQIQTSTDGTTWTPVATATARTGGNETLLVTGTARYVRMYGTERGTEWGYSLYEFKVYGSSCPTAS